MPPGTARALDRLDDETLSPAGVARALEEWRRLVGLPTAELWGPHNDWTEFAAPSVRGHLEDAVRALDRRDGAPLRQELARLDETFARKTSNNPFVDPNLPWWARRWWH